MEQEDNKSKKEKKKTVEQPELTLPQLIRVVKENPPKEEKTWKDRKMNGESIVNMMIYGYYASLLMSEEEFVD